MEEIVNNEVVANDVVTTEVARDMKEIVAELLKNNATRVKGLVIRSITPTKQDKYTRMGITINKNVPAMLADESGNFEEKGSNIIFASNFSIGALLKESEETAWAANVLINKPKVMAMVLTSATIDIVQQKVVAGEAYSNPFSRNSVEQYFDHDVIINHIISIKLSSIGMKMLSKVFDNLLMENDEE